MNGSAPTPSSGDDEWHTLGHQPGHKGHVPREAVELGNNDRASVGAPNGQRCGELRAAVQGIGTLAGLDLDELGGQHKALGLGKALNRGSLRFYAEA
jgi:hypothetical protein